MKGKTYYLLLTLALLFSCDSQSDKISKEIPEEPEFPVRIKEAPEIEADRIAFMNRHLQLSPDEAKQFWPVYDQYNILRRELWAQKHSILYRSRPNVELSHERAKLLIDSLQSLDEQLLELDKDLSKKLLEILPAEKVLRVYHAENRFKRHLMRQFRQRGERGR